MTDTHHLIDEARRPKGRGLTGQGQPGISTASQGRWYTAWITPFLPSWR
jgi:hypothetical protein